MRLQRSELFHLTESLKVLQQEREGDQMIIKSLRDFIESQGLDSTNNNNNSNNLDSAHSAEDSVNHCDK